MNPRSLRGIAALQATLCAGALALLAACGGGGGGGTDTAPAGTRAYTEGAITGFGSIIVNGVRFDDSGVAATDDDGNRGELKLGMQVVVSSGAVDDNGGQRTATASAISFGSEIKGPIEGAPDVANGRLTVLGQTVVVTATTVFDVSGGLSALAAGNIVEVHALYDAATASYRATRIERELSTSNYKLRGVITDLGTDTFKIGGATINYKTLNPRLEGPALANGQRVRVRLATTQTTAGVWNAERIRSGARSVEDQSEAHLKGVVSAFTSSTSFSIDGTPVDASNASFPDGTGFALGSVLEVEGQLVNGTLVARKVEREDHEDEARKNELHGVISGYSASAGTFTLRGVTVRLSSATVFDKGSVARLADGVRVEVKGRLDSDGVTVLATEIDFED